MKNDVTTSFRGGNFSSHSHSHYTRTSHFSCPSMFTLSHSSHLSVALTHFRFFVHPEFHCLAAPNVLLSSTPSIVCFAASATPSSLTLSPCHQYIFDVFFYLFSALGNKSSRTQGRDQQIGGWGKVEEHPYVVNTGGDSNFDHMALEGISG